MINKRKTDIAFKFLIQGLYGQNDYYKVKNSQTVAKAKRYYLKILDTFLIAINETIIISDKTHVQLLKSIISEGKKRLSSSKTFESLDNSLICTQTELIFQLIGNNPERNFEKNVPNRKDKWKLNRHRQIQYIQTNEQKLNQIFNLIQSRYSDRFPKFIDDFFNKVYLDECQSDFGNLIRWIKISHPDIYLEII
ncbi:hypothetical protein ACFSKN_17735 [Mariniflexile gromovii]|uniref:Uncharacterized protein n=1 Tax=Mariniflexile gromovii TaxID=362523 RepID=A0ABS4BX41_9FLAO|nr:hypothetical protein [Mariniflexile gromovii]MBP0905165.1 hypothetical protein [Mariniflexile gromovii]